jgi:hypothetical protein
VVISNRRGASGYSHGLRPSRQAYRKANVLVAVVTGNFLHEHHDPAPHGGIINSQKRDVI